MHVYVQCTGKLYMSKYKCMQIYIPVRILYILSIKFVFSDYNNTSAFTNTTVRHGRLGSIFHNGCDQV